MSINHSAELIKAYSADPIGLWVLEEYDATREQGNTICGDTISVFLQIDPLLKTIKKYSHSGEPQMFTLAAASMIAETIEGVSIEEVLSRWGEYMKGLGLDVSPRRKRSTVSALLAIHNALYQWQGIEKKETYDDILSY